MTYKSSLFLHIRYIVINPNFSSKLSSQKKIPRLLGKVRRHRCCLRDVREIASNLVRLRSKSTTYQCSYVLHRGRSGDPRGSGTRARQKERLLKNNPASERRRELQIRGDDARSKIEAIFEKIGEPGAILSSSRFSHRCSRRPSRTGFRRS